MANTDAYLLLGLSIVLGVVVLYSASLVLRFSQSHKLVRTLESLKDDE